MIFFVNCNICRKFAQKFRRIEEFFFSLFRMIMDKAFVIIWIL